MKILIANDTEAAHYYDRIAWLRVFKYCGFECEIWDVRKKSAFDAFSEFEPDVFFGQLHNFDRATLKNILARPDLKVAAKAGHWGPSDKDIDTKKYPVFVANDEHRKIAETLVKSGNLKYVFVHYPEQALEYTMDYWYNIVQPVDRKSVV